MVLSMNEINLLAFNITNISLFSNWENSSPQDTRFTCSNASDRFFLGYKSSEHKYSEMGFSDNSDSLKNIKPDRLLLRHEQAPRKILPTFSRLRNSLVLTQMAVEVV